MLKCRLRRPDADRPLPAGDTPRLLAVQIAGIGDLVLATPALRALRRRWPRAQIDLLTSPRAAELLAGSELVDRIHSVAITELRSPAALLRPGLLMGTLRAIASLRRERYDALLSLNNVASSAGGRRLALLLASLGVPLWVGRNTEGRLPCFDRELRESAEEARSEVRTKLDIAALLGAERTELPLELTLPAKAQRRVEALLGGGQGMLAVMPGANVEAKRWPARSFGEAASELLAPGQTLLLLGAKEDRSACDTVAEGVGAQRCIRLDGELGLAETGAALTRAELLLTNDTGPMHMAAALGLPLVALYAEANLPRYHPWAPEQRVRVCSSSPGVLDPRSEAGLRASVRGVAVEEVVRAGRELLEQARSGSASTNAEGEAR